MDGKQHGRWVWRSANGRTSEGLYVEGKRHGPWVYRSANGAVVSERIFVDGEIQSTRILSVPLQ